MVLRDLESFCLGDKELDDALEASITTLASDEFLTKYLITVPISLLGFAMFFVRVLCINQLPIRRFSFECIARKQ